MSHTPTPWEVYKQMYYFQICPEDNKLFTIATCPSETWGGFDGPRAWANAAHIVRCVNVHDQLVAALQKISANAAESTEWIRRVANQALTAAEKGA